MWPEAQRWRAPLGDFPPPWASAWGDDEFGLWAELEVGGVVQRMRWVEPSGPGGFWMGSSGKERARIANEGYQRWADEYESEPQRVVIDAGFWFADTPCTQAFWLAVMGGENPSEFKGKADSAQRPVEQVSWDDACGMLEKLAARPGLEGRPMLPSEAQWEYACRASSRTAYAWGDEADDTRANWRGLHEGTTPAAQFPANAWGLHDMHGNVWEWCADRWRDRWSPQLPKDSPPHSPPHSPPEAAPAGAPRAVRGGSWGGEPANARSAYRYWRGPGRRWNYLGFRFALRSPSPGPGGPSRY